MIINCPYCSGPVLKGLEELRDVAITVSFESRCPHCQKNVAVVLKSERIVIINEEFKSSNLGPGNIRLIQ
jgi:protein-disulfide isomerase